jgi:hypothetical protein
MTDENLADDNTRFSSLAHQSFCKIGRQFFNFFFANA